ncbi:hypothetical protein FA15DRAFT_662440 [Coprinopsis marcescibilis]|uniref:Hyaluronan/mRNA-binding protein domain-containing protein n=1 Tax=Coprinopsis marcescibilis TaxID=230819 RepID=A0A5C3LCW9_COPMA|nr:hypothetical protein FA15DRAFT_662440 [Coprinopsis marcescibilis]
MSVASKNPFALLDAEDNSRPASPPAKKAPVAPQAAAPANRGQQKTRGGPASRAGKYYARGGKPSPNDASTPAGAEEPGVDGRKSDGGRGGRGPRGRGRGGNTGGRGRQFDRHSATGKTDSQKKVHQGWGGDEGNSELKTEQAAAADAAAEPATGEWAADAIAPAEWGTVEADAAAPADAEGKPESKPRKEREEREEEEDNTLTLDQYLAQQKDKDTVIPKLDGVRQANEGAGEEIWKGVVPLAKNEEEEAYFVGKAKSAPKLKSKKEDKVYLDFEGRFERPDRGGRGRGRGGDRGERRGARGAGRGGRGQRQGGNAQTPNVDDQNAFPSLA